LFKYEHGPSIIYGHNPMLSSLEDAILYNISFFKMENVDEMDEKIKKDILMLEKAKNQLKWPRCFSNKSDEMIFKIDTCLQNADELRSFFAIHQICVDVHEVVTFHEDLSFYKNKKMKTHEALSILASAVGEKKSPCMKYCKEVVPGDVKFLAEFICEKDNQEKYPQTLRRAEKALGEMKETFDIIRTSEAYNEESFLDLG